jgi:hypothetical protein
MHAVNPYAIVSTMIGAIRQSVEFGFANPSIRE